MRPVARAKRGLGPSPPLLLSSDLNTPKLHIGKSELLIDNERNHPFVFLSEGILASKETLGNMLLI